MGLISLNEHQNYKIVMNEHEIVNRSSQQANVNVQ